MKHTDLSSIAAWICGLVIFAFSTGRCAEEPQSNTISQRYRVQNILRPRYSENRAIRPFGKLLLPDEESIHEGHADHAFIEPESYVTAAQQEIPNTESLVELLEDLFWQDGISFKGFCETLFVNAPPDIQDKIKAVLDELNRRALARIRLECLVVPLETLDTTLPGWRSDAPWLPVSAFRKLLAAPSSKLFTAVVCNGQTTALASGTQKRFLSNNSINQTGVSPVSNPFLKSLFDGLRVEAESFLSAGRDTVRLDLGFQARDIAGRLKTISKDLHRFELPRVKETCLWSTVFIPKNRVLVAGGFSGGIDAESVVLLVRINPIGAGAMARTGKIVSLPGGYTLSLFDVPLLLRKPEFERPLFKLGLAELQPDLKKSQRGKNEEMFEPFDHVRGRRTQFESLLKEYLFHDDENMGEISFYDNVLKVKTKKEAALRSVEDLLRQYEHPAMTFIDLNQVTLSRSIFAQLNQELDSSGVLPANWKEKLDKGAFTLRCVATGLAGQIISSRRVDAETIIRGANGVSGGTTYTLTELVATNTEDAGSGFAFEMRADTIPGSEQVSFECCGIQSETDTSKEHDVIMHECKPGLVSKPLHLKLTIPDQKVHTWRVHMVLPQKCDVLMDVDIADDNTVRLLIGNVRIITP